MAFSPQQLISFLPDHQVTCHIAFSGGLDSHVLLHAMCQLRDSAKFKGEIKALHVHHGLSNNADDWATHCGEICAAYQVPLEIEKISVEKAGQGVENAARNARLAVFQKQLCAEELLLTAHHLDDQMETMLFRMLRGTGLRGLSGVSARRPLGKGYMLKPLLGFARNELVTYANQHELKWIEDESNQLVDFDRNYLRKEIMPLLAFRWPGYRKNWQRLSQLAKEGEVLQKVLGMQDLAVVQEGIHRLSISALKGFIPERQRNIVRCWFLSFEERHNIPAPDYYVVKRIFEELIPAAEDAVPLVTWEKAGVKVEIRRFASSIYLVLAQNSVFEPSKLMWDTTAPMDLPDHLGTLSLIESNEQGVEIQQGEILEIAFKQGGETVKPAGRKTRSLMKTLQDYHVPPWLRDKTPLILHDNELIAVADLFVCDQFLIKKSTANTQKIYKFQWDRPDLHCGY